MLKSPPVGRPRDAGQSYGSGVMEALPRRVLTAKSPTIPTRVANQRVASRITRVSGLATPNSVPVATTKPTRRNDIDAPSPTVDSYTATDSRLHLKNEMTVAIRS